MLTFKPLQLLTAGLLLLVSFPVGATNYSPQRTGGGNRSDDDAIVASIKSNFYSYPELKLMQIDVDSNGGVVKLSGLVDSFQTKTKLEELVRQEHGVVSVEDNLTVR